MKQFLVLLLLPSFQAAAAPTATPAQPTKVAAIEFDLARVKPADPATCGPSQGSELVVCGRRKPYAYPLDAMARIYGPKPLRAQVGLGAGATAGVHVEQKGLATGVTSRRIMVGVKVPF